MAQRPVTHTERPTSAVLGPRIAAEAGPRRLGEVARGPCRPVVTGWACELAPDGRPGPWTRGAAGRAGGLGDAARPAGDRTRPRGDPPRRGRVPAGRAGDAYQPVALRRRQGGRG